MVTFEVHELDPGAITAEGVWVGPLLAIPIVDCARLSCKTARPDHVQTNLNIRGFSAHLQAGAILNTAPATTNHEPWGRHQTQCGRVCWNGTRSRNHKKVLTAVLCSNLGHPCIRGAHAGNSSTRRPADPVLRSGWYYGIHPRSAGRSCAFAMCLAGWEKCCLRS